MRPAAKCFVAQRVHAGWVYVTNPVQNCVHHSETGFSEPSCVFMVFWGLPIQSLGHFSLTTVAPSVTVSSYIPYAHI